MDEELLGAIVAGFICMGCWGVIALLLGLGAHWRMVRVERADGVRAVPADELPLLWYAVSSIAWPLALGFAIVGLAKRSWARAGRNAAFILLGHFTVYVAGSVVMSSAMGRDSKMPVAIVAYACVLVMLGAITSTALTWRWSGLRAARIEREPASKPPLGAERYAYYVGSFVVWPAGLLAAALLKQPHDVRVGTNALRCSIVALLLTALAVCIGVPLFVAFVAPPS